MTYNGKCMRSAGFRSTFLSTETKAGFGSEILLAVVYLPYAICVVRQCYFQFLFSISDNYRHFLEQSSSHIQLFCLEIRNTLEVV